MTTATIAGVRFTTTQELFETNDTGFADVDVAAEWVEPGPDIPGMALAGPDHTYLWVETDNAIIRLPALAEGVAERSWQLRQTAPIVAAAFGHLTLHASAIEHPASVVAFVGGTGAGKSTLAWECSKAGSAAVADDVLPIRFNDHPRAPAPDGLKPVGAVCFLTRGNPQPELVRLDASTALQRHVANGFGEHGDAAIWAQQFDAYHHIVDAVPHFDLTIPDDRQRLPEVVAWLDAALAEAAG